VVNRFVGGGHKRRLRIVDFYRLESGEHDVVRIEYDPGRSAHIALIRQRGKSANVSEEDGAVMAETEVEESQLTGTTDEKRRKRNEVRGGWSYILAPEGVRAGDVVVSYRAGIPPNLVEGLTDTPAADTDPSSPQTVEQPEIAAGNTASVRALGLLRTATLKPGNVLPLYLVPAGTVIHNIALSVNGRMQLCRSAGSSAQIIAHHGPKGEALGGAEILSMGGDIKPNGERSKKMGSVLVKLQSGEVRRIEPGCVATVGTVSK
jgi:ribosomal protein L2